MTLFLTEGTEQREREGKEWGGASRPQLAPDLSSPTVTTASLHLSQGHPGTIFRDFCKGEGGVGSPIRLTNLL